MNLRQLIFLLLFFNSSAWLILVSGIGPGELHFDFLSVGQGDSEIISLPSGASILIDGGPDKSILFELEKSAGRRKYIDLIILSHPHADHYVGLSEVIERYGVGMVLLPEAESGDPAFLEFLAIAKFNGVRLLTVSAGDIVRSEDFNIGILSPSDEDDLHDMNARSVVALFESEGIKALFTGDIGSKQESRLVERYDIDSDIIKVPHHGSAYSSSSVFLKEASPAVSVIGVGRENRYGFPKREVLDRLSAAGSAVYRTDKDGSVRIVPSEGKFKILKLK